jgi:hypothetical protein
MNLRALLPLAAVALIGASEPIEVVKPGEDTSPERFREFGLAALACVDATQTNDTPMTAIENRGWLEYSQKDPEIAKLIATFARDESSIFIMYHKDRRECSADWPLATSLDADTLMAAALPAVTEQLAPEHPEAARSELIRPQTYRITAGESLGILRVEASNDSPVRRVIFSSINKADLEARRSSAQQPPSQTPQGQ